MQRVRLGFRAVAVSVAASLIAFALGLGLRALVGDVAPFLTYFPAIVVATLYGGRGGGWLALALATVLALLGFADVRNLQWQVGWNEGVLTAAFVVINLFLVWLIDGLSVARRKAQAALFAGDNAASQISQILDTVTDAFATIDRQWRYVYVNDSALRAYGTTRDEFIGRSLWEHFPHLVGTEFEQRARSAMDAGEPERLEFYSQRLNRWFDYRFYPSADGVTLYATDIHERKSIERQRELLLESERAARGELEKTNRLKDEFLATLSHELRTPLNVILGWASFIRMSKMSEEEISEAVATIERNARLQAQLIEDLLEMNAIISGKIRLDIQDLDLPLVIEAALETVRHAAEAKQITISKTIDSHAGPVRGDPARLQQVVWNLLSNAIKFTPAGGSVRITLRSGKAEQVEIEVADSGQGINVDFLPHVFERFRQADASSTRRVGGLGLGLSIVHHLVELHGGTVTAQSAGEGQGATFTVQLPVAWRQADSTRDKLPSPCAVLPVELHGVRVMVVDDEPDACRLVKRVLEERSAVVETASSASEAFDRMAISRPDVLISDIGMPVEDGYEFIRRVRAITHSVLANVPAVALTAFARADDRRRSHQAGYQVHLSKPVDSGELVAIVANLAGRR